MKQRFLLALVFVCAFMVTTRAQISKGAIWVGGSFGYNHQGNGPDTSYTKTNYLNIAPAVGLVVKDNLVVGISLLYGHGKTNTSNSGSGTKSNDYGAGIFVRQYLPIVSRLYFFGQASANYTSSKLKTNSNIVNGITENKTKTGSLSVTPGISFAVTKKFHLETSLNNLFSVAYMKGENSYTARPGDKPNVNKTEQFTAGLSSGGTLQFNVGCRFLL